MAKIHLFGKPTDFIDFQENQRALEIIARHARDMGIECVLAPNVRSANRLVVDESAFTKELYYDGVRILCGISADGAELKKQTAFFIASADCPTLVLRFPDGRIIATHAGRASLLGCGNSTGNFTNEGAMLGEGVIAVALKRFCGNPQNIHASVFCGISAEYFTHPIKHPAYGNVNRDMIGYVCRRWGQQCFGPDIAEGNLNLFELIFAQLKEAGVCEKYIWHDGACTYSDLISPEKHMWWSHRRGTAGRNGILVMRLG